MDTDMQIAVLRESFGRVVYTHKTHEKERERLSEFATVSKWTNIILSALTFGGVVAAIGTAQGEWLAVSLLFSTVSAGYSVFQLSFDPSRRAEAHRAAAKSFLGIRNRYIVLLADAMDESVDHSRLRLLRDQLESDAADAFALAPDTSPKAYEKARTALKMQEEMTFSDEELDRFLPARLRLGEGRGQN